MPDASPATSLTNARFTGPRGQDWIIAADQGEIALTFITSTILRVAFTPTGAPPHQTWSLAPEAVTRSAALVDAHVGPEMVQLQSRALTVSARLAPFHLTVLRPDGPVILADAPEGGIALDSDGYPTWRTALQPDERVFGGGQRTGGLNQRGRRITHWCSDPLPNHNTATDMLYQSVPFLVGLHAGQAHGVYVDTNWRTVFDIGLADPAALHVATEGPDLVAYVCAGPDLAAVMEQYTSLTGRMPPQPRWSLGNQQSRWSYMDAAEVAQIAQNFRERQIPCDAIYLDIDYMRGYRDFTWDPDRFPDPAALIAQLREMGFQVVPIIDPGVKVDPDYTTYQEGLERGFYARNPDGTPFAGWVWPGLSVWADFSREEVRAWWAAQHKSMLDMGVAGIWDDMNEPSQAGMSAPPEVVIPFGATLPPETQFGPPDAPISHAAFHNAYGHEMTRATRLAQTTYFPDRRPFVLTRAATAGTQRYAIVWNGDNTSMWEHLRLAITMNLGLGLSGFPVTGVDIGGFWQDTAPELLTRFTQLGALLPFCRNHSAKGTARQEPWVFGEPYTSAIRAAINQRYRLLPLLMTLCHEANQTGAPIMRPLAWIAPDDPASAACDDEFLLGADLLCAPVLDPAATERAVLLPPGDWFAWATGDVHTGPARITIPVTLESQPLFSRAGSIIPTQGDAQTTAEVPDEPLTLEVFLSQPGQTATARLWDDDDHPQAQARGSYLELQAAATWDGDAIIARLAYVGGQMVPRYPAVAVALTLPPAYTTAEPIRECSFAELPQEYRFTVTKE